MAAGLPTNECWLAELEETSSGINRSGPFRRRPAGLLDDSQGSLIYHDSPLFGVHAGRVSHPLVGMVERGTSMPCMSRLTALRAWEVTQNGTLAPYYSETSLLKIRRLGPAATSSVTL